MQLYLLYLYEINFKHMSALIVVFVLFGLAIVSPIIFPNKMLSDNKHDINNSTEQ